MVDTNDITGERLTSKLRGKRLYDENYDKIFGGDKTEDVKESYEVEDAK